MKTSQSIFITLFLTGMVAQVQAAGFDCSKAKTPTEKAICADKALSALDDSMAQSYKDALAKSPQDSTSLKTKQRLWLKGMAEECSDSLECLKPKYEQRIKLLSAIASGIPTAAASRFPLNNVSTRYDFTLSTQEHCAPAKNGDDSSCEGPGAVTVYAKGQKAPLQIINMENIFISFNKNAQPLTNSANLYDYQGVINVGDFNFDGKEDFAVQNGNHGSYGGPSYDVYLQSADGKHFDYSGPFSSLIEETLGFFEIDVSNKRLLTMAKSGCCYHEKTAYQIVGNQPKAVQRWIEDAASNQQYVLEIEEKLVNGKWQKHEKRVRKEK